jgi:hypothetical protein
MRFLSPFVAALLATAPVCAQTAIGPAPAAPVAPAAPAAGNWRTLDLGILQTLDKVTGRVRTLEAPLEREVTVGTLSVILRACRKRPPDEPPESAAYLDIVERKQGEQGQGVFRGWMFASAPAVSAMDHPVYDIWVVDCRAAPR